LRTGEYHMVITDMRMESDASGAEVIAAARTASYHPAVALLTAFPVAEDDWQGMGADKMLVKPMHTRILLQQIEKLLEGHEAKLKIWSTPSPKAAVKAAARPVAGKKAAKKVASKKVSKKAKPAKKSPSKKTKRA
jgi:DNA-binding response OmpR family regulator